MKRCAIYTRKSSDEGLEQDFNSLDAQREACEAYVRSQAGEDWIALPKAYDDGGYSGGSMERPGLQALLSDIRAGLVDVVVVYKIDRLTRSLADFARIVETFDGTGTSFVSVTQAFNTTSSMGRLTLNVLLSFAQFEREVTGERIRDKIAASKAKGLWMGGLPPLGYDAPSDRSRVLQVNPVEAQTVKTLFERYLELGSVYRLLDNVEARGIRSKSRTTAKGKQIGGQPFSRGAMFHLLQNQVYVGNIVHKGIVHAGQHDAIIDQALFDAVQAMIASHRRERLARRKSESPLNGKVLDRSGRRMTVTFSRGARGKRYRYFVTPEASVATADRISGRALEEFVGKAMRRWLPAENPFEQLISVKIEADQAVFTLADRLRNSVRANLAGDELILASERPGAFTVLAPSRLGRKRQSGQKRSAVPTGRDPVLIAALRSAHAMLASARGGIPHLEVIPRPRYDRRILRLAFLAPDLQAAILDGRQPAGLCLEAIVRSPMPISWEDQRKWVLSLAS